jgi:catechol-2,3-dioxygenase
MPGRRSESMQMYFIPALPDQEHLKYIGLLTSDLQLLSSFYSFILSFQETIRLTEVNLRMIKKI